MTSCGGYPIHDEGLRTGFLVNYHVTAVQSGTEGRNNSNKDPAQAASSATNAAAGGGGGTSEGGASALQLYFYDLKGDTFEAALKYKPYFFVIPTEGHEREVELGLTGTFGSLIASIQTEEKEDLDMINHLSGKKRVLLRLSFMNTTDLTAVRSKVDAAVKRNASMADVNPLDAAGGMGVGITGSMAGLSGPNSSASPFHDDAAAVQARRENDRVAWMQWVAEIREYDVKYYTRLAIDLNVFVGLWYDVTVSHGTVVLERCDDSKYPPTVPRICAYDIETTKAPLKFPQPEVDQIYMISYMLDQRGYLIVNREIVTEDVEPFDYCPRPEYEGSFEIFNEENEMATLRRFFDEMKAFKPHVYVTYNGDYFDFPFIQARASFHGMNMRREIGFGLTQEGPTLNRSVPHLDCFYWVKRDSYLPQGSHGLKAVTRAKLGFDPVEVDPEEMLPLAQSHPQRMAAYSVSDAVSTYYLYMKYVHPFIYSLCTIIPMPPDDVLRKGSGTLCESLLMVQAYAKNVVYPNKKQADGEKFFNGHLIDSETYIGGHVEALRSGVFRSSIPLKFECNADAYESLAQRLDGMLEFAIENENGCKLSEVTNYDEVKNAILEKLNAIRDSPNRTETPMIYHLDVGAMYPNIILTNRLQPSSIVPQEMCAGCCFNSPNNENKCRRAMSWIWKGEMFTAGRQEYARIKAQLESESFGETQVDKINASGVSKQTYGTKRGNVLEGTTFEAKFGKRFGGDKGGGGGGGGGYRNMNKQQQQEAREALLKPDADAEDADSDDEDGANKKYHKLEEKTQTILLKKRLGEYSRKAYRKTHESRVIMKEHIVCQRENSFYVDTVRLFRDRRYHYKRELKRWKGVQDASADGSAQQKEAKGRVVQMESLQLAHKCILNSFYGYVMRKGSRWYSMEMAGIVTYCGASLITIARELVEKLGVTLELDTDGIWCCLPSSFPENYVFKTNNPKKPKFEISYPCLMLNKDVNDRYSNEQYQTLVGQNEYTVHSECSIYFEVDGPYAAMILPASREEGKSIKKRYAVFHPDGRLAELKGFELKRRGELMLIKDFQSLVFKRFLDGSTLQEAYASAAEVANEAMDMLMTQGAGYEEDEIIAKLTECGSMSRRLDEYGENQKSLALCTARRIAEFLGPQMVKDKGLQCKFVISKMPIGRPVTDRAIPLNIIKADPQIRVHFLRKWTADKGITEDFELRQLLDWDYYIARFSSCVQKIITIPAAFQNVPNPVPRVKHPDWLEKTLRQRNSKYRQLQLSDVIKKTKATTSLLEATDMEDLGGGTAAAAKGGGSSKKDRGNGYDVDGDGSSDEDNNGCGSDDDVNYCGENGIRIIGGKNMSKKQGGRNGGGAEDVEEAEAIGERLRRIEEEKHEAEEQETFEKGYFSGKGAMPLDGDFFGSVRSSKWLRNKQQMWSQRAKLREELGEEVAAVTQGKLGVASATGGGGGSGVAKASSTNNLLTAAFVDAKAKALSSQWHILEIREGDAPNLVKIFAMVENSLFAFSCIVDRSVIVDVRSHPSTIEGGRVVAGRVLPRKADVAGTLVEVNVASAQSSGDAMLQHLTYTREDIDAVYESNVTLVQRAVMQLGCVSRVDAKAHLANVKTRAQRDAFHYREFDSTLGSSHYVPNGLRSCFVYHSVSGDGNRGLLAAIYPATNEAIAVFVQPAAAQRPTIQWKQMLDEATESLGASKPSQAKGGSLEFKMFVASDMRGGFRYIEQSLIDASFAPNKPHLVILQSATTTSALLHTFYIPSLANLPVMRVLGAQEDDRIFAQSPLMWTRDVSRRMLQRYLAAPSWMEERVLVCRVAQVPLCNLLQDIYVSGWDALFSRALKRHGHVLWNKVSAMDEAPNERPTKVLNAGGHCSYCIELSVSQLEIVAVLFSQMIQEGDDPSSHALCDGGVTSHFHVLRDTVSEMYGLAVQRKEAAISLLLNFPRWIRDTMAQCYEPNLVALISRLANRALATLLIRMSKLGGTIVRATSHSIYIGTTKPTLSEAMTFAKYLCSSLKDHTMLNHLNLQPYKLWSVYVAQDMLNEAGFFVDAAAFQDVADTATAQNSLSLTHKQAFYTFAMHSRFPLELKQWFVQRVTEFLSLLEFVRDQVHNQILDDASISLATRSEKFQERLATLMCKAVEEEIQPKILDEVNTILQDPGRFEFAATSSAAAVAAPSSGGGTAAAAGGEGENAKLHSGGTSTDHASPSININSSSGGGGAATQQHYQRGGGTGGGDQTLALQYCKALCHFLDFVPEVQAAVRKTKNNCLRLCGVGVFAPEAHWENDPPTILNVVCSFCNEEISLDLAEHSARHAAPAAAGARAAADEWHCSYCSNAFAADSIEMQLIRSVTQLMTSYSTDDAVCVKCKQSPSTLMTSTCPYCSGALVPKLNYAAARRRLHTLRDVAEKLSFHWLQDSVRAALACVGP